MKEEIKKILNDKTSPSFTIEEIINVLDLNTVDEYKKVQEELNAMVKDGSMYYSEKKKKYLLMENSHFLKGRLMLNKKGFGFVILENSKQKDVYINEKNINNARNDDIVLIEMIDKKLNEGKIVRVLNRDNSDIVGEFFIKDNLFYVRPDKKNKSIIEIPKEMTGKSLING